MYQGWVRPNFGRSKQTQGSSLEEAFKCLYSHAAAYSSVVRGARENESGIL